MKQKRLNVRIEEPVCVQLGILKAQTGKSLAYHVEEALKAYLKGQKRPPK